MDGEDIFLAMFAIIFAAFGAGQASSYGPDAAKAIAPAMKIFTIVDTPTKINALEVPEGSIEVPPTFQGSIEFRDVWFRYPMRPKHWVFKGLNLKINPKDSIAIVGESGQGKSTLILLLMRFYDIDKGDILIDGVSIKDYNIASLRQRMGLVMQEPTLFNYSVKENILYGNSFASNLEVAQACEVANAKVFVESDELQYAIEDDCRSLMTAMSDGLYKEKLIEKLGAEEFNKKFETIKKLVAKEEKEGKFKYIEGEMDKRTPEQIGELKELHNGYSIQCGTKGSKLSGGQKQRIAIARAVIRQPHLLLLDEATSALDEESQRKVQAALEQVMKGRTSIVVAHRLTTVEKCNRIAVIEDGVVIEEGTFSDLQKKETGYF